MDFSWGETGGAVLGITFNGGEVGFTNGLGLALGILLAISCAAALLAIRFSTLLKLGAGRGAWDGLAGAGTGAEGRALPKLFFIVAFLSGDNQCIQYVH